MPGDARMAGAPEQPGAGWERGFQPAPQSTSVLAPPDAATGGGGAQLPGDPGPDWRALREGKTHSIRAQILLNSACILAILASGCYEELLRSSAAGSDGTGQVPPPT